jgi:hypothetical protein
LHSFADLDASVANEGDPTPARKKAQYAGGLVLEPVKGGAGLS